MKTAEDDIKEFKESWIKWEGEFLERVLFEVQKKFQLIPYEQPQSEQVFSSPNQDISDCLHPEETQ